MNQSANGSPKKASEVNYWIFLAFFLGAACVIAFVTGGMGTVSSGASTPSATQSVLTTPR
jgi:hypothetical protein